jgi:hypothetical protein
MIPLKSLELMTGDQLGTLKKLRSARLASAKDVRKDDWIRLTGRSVEDPTIYQSLAWYRVMEPHHDCGLLGNTASASAGRREVCFVMSGELDAIVKRGFSGGAASNRSGQIIGMTIGQNGSDGIALKISDILKDEKIHAALTRAQAFPILESSRSIPIPHGTFNFYAGIVLNGTADGYDRSRSFRGGATVKLPLPLTLHLNADAEPFSLRRERFGELTDLDGITTSLGLQFSPWSNALRAYHPIANVYLGAGLHRHDTQISLLGPLTGTQISSRMVHGWYVEVGTRYFPFSRWLSFSPVYRWRKVADPNVHPSGHSLALLANVRLRIQR